MSNIVCTYVHTYMMRDTLLFTAQAKPSTDTSSQHASQGFNFFSFLRAAARAPLISLPYVAEPIAQPLFALTTFLQMGRLDYMSGAPPGEEHETKKQLI